MLHNDDVRIPPAGHLGMSDDDVFMEREDWLENGEPFSKVFCPVSAAERGKRLKGKEKREFLAGHEEGEMISNAMVPSALYSRYDWDLHQMVAYMRRLDGATQTVRQHKRMDPMGRLGDDKWAVEGSRTSFFNFWTYVAWDNVFAPILGKAFGQDMRVVVIEDVDDLLGATVMM
jgi:hypothetical protein